MRSRKPRPCKQCGTDLEPGTRKHLCETCRATPNPRCKKCKKVKPLTRFSYDASRPSGHFPWCMDCQKDKNKSASWQDETAPLNGHTCPLCDTPIRGHSNRRFCSNSCKDRVSTIRNKYKMAVGEYRRLLDDTGGVCPICGDRPTVWQIEHDHGTGLVTGLVCAPCNVGLLAYSGHSIKRVKALLSYLEETPASRLGIEARVPEEYNVSSNLHKRWNFGRKR
jgi:hypothetical protein